MLDRTAQTDEPTSRQRRIGNHLLAIVFFGATGLAMIAWIMALGRFSFGTLDYFVNWIVPAMNDFEGLSDHFLLRMYEFIRNEVMADALAGTSLVGAAARQRAERLCTEIERRGLLCKRIAWPERTNISDGAGEAPMSR